MVRAESTLAALLVATLAVGACATSTAMKRGRDARALLARHDSYGFFSALGELVTTGPTRTNVNDYRAILVL